MGKDNVKILGSWSSPYTIRVRIALNMKSVEYEFLGETFGTKSELLLKSNPVHKKMPVMIHHGKPICESLIIVEYIDEVWSSGPSILPSDHVQRAIARFWGAYVDEKFYPIFRGLHTARDQEAKKAVAQQVAETLDVLENAFAELSNGKPFFGGDTIGYVDIALGSRLGWIRALSKLDGLTLLDGSKFPRLVKWADTFCSHPAAKDLIPDTDRVIEFAKILRATWFAPGSPN